MSLRRFLLCAGVQGEVKALQWLRRLVQERKPDALLFAGGILGARREAAHGASLWSLALKEAQFAEEFFATLGDLAVFSAVIPGPGGQPLEEFLRLGMWAELTYPNVHIAHATLVAEDGVALCGIGGSMAETVLIGIDSYSRVTAEFFLRSLWRARQPCKILLLASPPPGALGGVEGEPLVGDLIDDYHPDLCVVAGSDARRGSERIGNTLVVNPGCLADGHAAWLDWSRPVCDQVEMLELGGAAQFAGAERGIGD
jgi:Icc-related predicted phosphoesterase